ncbi:MAG: TetR/AcrR family transcriptional regulator [Planctomycetes bacterium]|nr:TetR/AcrR family transcriptional regulator [Planctomycetota bacterium]
MSENTRQPPSTGDLDRRVRRTQALLNAAFVELFHEQRYDEIRVRDILERAAVGRATFYEHFRGKDELLIHSMAPFFAILTDCAFETADPAALGRLLEHFRANAAAARSMFAGPNSGQLLPLVVRRLGALIERRLEACDDARSTSEQLPRRLLALQIAEAQFALIRAWLLDAQPCATELVGAALIRTSRALVATAT